jgi:hypothetical protein
MGYFNQAPQGYNTLREFATDPQVVQQHIQQSLQGQPQQSYQSQMSPFAGGMHDVMHAGATNPQTVQQHIAQDLGYQGPQANQYGYAGQNQFNPAAMQQVMHAAPAQVQGAHGQQLGYNAQPQYANSYFPQAQNSAFGEFGTNPQVVRQHIQQDLANQQGAMTSQQAGGYRPQQMSYGQGITAQQNYGQQPQGGMFSQFGTNPQAVRQQIQQDLNGYQ